MSRIRKAVIAALIATGGIVLIALASFAFVPDAAIERMLSQALKQRASIGLKSGGIRKAFPFGVRIEDPVFFSMADGEDMMSLDSLTVRLKPLNLLYGELRFDATGEDGAGTMNSRIRVDRRRAHVLAEIKDLSIMRLYHGISALGVSDGLVSGNLDATLYHDEDRCPEASVNLTASGIDLKGLSGVMQPGFSGKMDAKVSADLNDCAVALNDVWLTTELMRSRVSGAISVSPEIKKSGLDLQVELFPEKTAGPVMMLFSGYKRTMNSYSMQIKGTVEAPVIEAQGKP